MRTVLSFITGEHVIPFYSDEETLTEETDAAIRRKISTGNIPTMATREVAQVFAAPPKIGRLYKNMCQTKPAIRWALDRIDAEWADFQAENAADPRKWKNCLQNDGEVCQGEYANKRPRLVEATTPRAAN